MTAALPTSKRERIVYVLDHWDDIFNPPLASTNPIRGRGGNGFLPGMSRHASVVELVRCLEVLRLEAPTQYAHLMASHRAEWRIKRVPRRSKGGKAVLRRDGVNRLVQETRPVRERLVPAWVDTGKVYRAQSRLVDLFRGACRLPEEFEDALTLSAEEIAEKRLRRRSKHDAATAAA